MPTWDYDSYCNDNVMDYINEYSLEELFDRVEEDVEDYLREGFFESNLELVVGISIYCIRNGKNFSLEFLKLLLDIFNILLENGKFTDWRNIILRKNRLEHEKLIVKNVIIKKPIQFGKIINKPKNFNNLNNNYYKTKNLLITELQLFLDQSF